jgi:hypothetical protein
MKKEWHFCLEVIASKGELLVLWVKVIFEHDIEFAAYSRERQGQFLQCS